MMYIKYDYSSPSNYLFELIFPEFPLSDHLPEYVRCVEIYDHTIIVKMHAFLNVPGNVVYYSYKQVNGKLEREPHEVPSLNKIKNNIFKQHKDPMVLKVYNRSGNITDLYTFTYPIIKLYPVDDIVFNVFYKKLIKNKILYYII